MMTRKEIEEFCESRDIVLTLFDGYDHAFKGVYYEEEIDAYRPVYCTNTIIESLISDGMDHEEAIEYYEYNIVRTAPYMKPHVPLFIEFLEKV